MLTLDVSECEVLDSISQIWPGGGFRAPVVIEEERIASRLADSAARDLDHGPDNQKRNNRGTARIQGVTATHNSRMEVRTCFGRRETKEQDLRHHAQATSTGRRSSSAEEVKQERWGQDEAQYRRSKEKSVIGKPAKATPLPPYHSCCRPVVVIENAAHSPAEFALETCLA